MNIRKAYKFRLKTNMEIKKLIFQFLGCNRLIWNKALALQKNFRDKIKKLLPHNHLAGCLVDWKNRKAQALFFVPNADIRSIQIMWQQ